MGGSRLFICHNTTGGGDHRNAEAAQNLLADAMAQGLGVVEKIDFDKLTFETDDE